MREIGTSRHKIRGSILTRMG